jgi:hypothetical protein
MARKKKTTKRGAKTGRKRAGVGPKSTGGGRGPGRPASLASASVEAIRAELARRLDELHRRRAELQESLAAVEAEIARIDGVGGRGAPRAGAAGSPARRPRSATGRSRTGGTGGGRRNATSLAQALHALLADRTMAVGEISEAVQAAGYRTSSPNFRNIVSQTLIGNPDLFERVARGRYTAR